MLFQQQAGGVSMSELRYSDDEGNSFLPRYNGIVCDLIANWYTRGPGC